VLISVALAHRWPVNVQTVARAGIQHSIWSRQR
jgi:hypothetical protein